MQTTNPSELTFNPETHEYLFDGKKLPGVTTVLGSIGIINTAWFTEEAAWRGSVIHKACELDDLDDLDESTVAEEAGGYLAAYRRFKREMLFIPKLIEKPMMNAMLGFAGTPDRIGTMLARSGREQEAVLDLKTGAMERWHRLQTAAYTELCGAFSRYVLRLKSDGSYAVTEFPMAERRRDFQLFQAALAVYQFKESNQ